MESRQTAIPRKTFLAGVIYFDERKRTVNCIVRELSADEATLVCRDAGAVLANSIELYIPTQNKFYPAEIKERNASELRIEFRSKHGDFSQIHDADQPEGGMPEMFRRLRLLEAEVKQLRRMVDELRTKQVSDLAI